MFIIAVLKYIFVVKLFDLFDTLETGRIKITPLTKVLALAVSIIFVTLKSLRDSVCVCVVLCYPSYQGFRAFVKNMMHFTLELFIEACNI